jgi:MoxR-like ATPase
MPSDVTGHAVLDPPAPGERGIGTLRIHQGPVFTHLLLADEINRAPAKTQSALLEVMQEYQVTLEGQAMPLPRPFMVLATQNPVDTEGTYPLPEAQMDRFLLKIDIGYPSAKEEHAIVQRTTQQRAGDQLPLDAVRPVLAEPQVLTLQRMASLVRADERVVDYAVRITRATREWPGLSAGAGPRGAVALVRTARAAALMAQRDFITPDDVARQALPALRHRVQVSPDAQLEGMSADNLLRAALGSVEVPRL